MKPLGGKVTGATIWLSLSVVIGTGCGKADEHSGPTASGATTAASQPAGSGAHASGGVLESPPPATLPK